MRALQTPPTAALVAASSAFAVAVVSWRRSGPYEVRLELLEARAPARSVVVAPRFGIEAGLLERHAHRCRT
jgi:hypothetical protein